MGSYEQFSSPERLRQASLLVIGLSGASTGLLGGIGWGLFHDGFRELAVRVWLVSGAAVVTYLLVAVLARVVALLVETGRPAQYAQALRRLQDRVDHLERELDSAGTPRIAASPQVSTFTSPAETAAS